MKFAIRLPNGTHVPSLVQSWEPKLDAGDIARAVQRAEALGFDMIATPEHFFIPADQVGASGDHYFHVFATLGFLAGVTRTIRLTSAASILPLQHPIVTAKGLATADWLSGGRAQLTFAAGWLKAEFDVLGVPFHERGRICDEYLAAIIELLTKERPSFEGKYVSFKDIAFEPKAWRKPRPPIWLAGDAEPVLKRVARFADGWNPWLTKPEELASRLDFIRAQPAYDGRPLEVYYTPALLRLKAHHETVDDPRAAGTHDVQAAVDLYGQLAEAGVTMTMVPAPPVADLEGFLDHLQWVMEEIKPRLPGG